MQTPRTFPSVLWSSVAVVAATLALAIPATALAGGFTAHLYMGREGHQPRVGRQHIKVTAYRGRRPLSGSVRYLFTFDSQVVGRRWGGRFRHGVFHDTLRWPADAVCGCTIHIEAVVKTRYGTDVLPWWIKVRP